MTFGGDRRRSIRALTLAFMLTVFTLGVFAEDGFRGVPGMSEEIYLDLAGCWDVFYTVVADGEIETGVMDFSWGAGEVIWYDSVVIDFPSSPVNFLGGDAYVSPTGSAVLQITQVVRRDNGVYELVVQDEANSLAGSVTICVVAPGTIWLEEDLHWVGELADELGNEFRPTRFMYTGPGMHYYRRSGPVPTPE
jgi:hypothetical protein